MNVRSEEKDRRSRIVLGAIILLLFIVNGLLIYKLIDKENQREELAVDNQELEEDRLHLEKLLEETEGQLLEVKGENQQLDSIVLAKNSIIEAKLAELREALRDKNITRNKLNKLEKERIQLLQQINRYKYEVDSLRLTVAELRDTVSAKNQLIEQQREDYSKLEKNFNDAAKKVAIGSRLQAIDMVAAGIREKRFGSGDKDVTRLARADFVRISFKLANNEVADKGERMIYLKLITPSEATLYNESKGSGSFTFNGEESLYTMKQKVNFQNQNETVVFEWEKSPGMMEGDYEAYVISGDHIIGRQTLSLK